jgi:FtsP/CotA-like multicopper oxidase with cupredoxin domain
MSKPKINCILPAVWPGGAASRRRFLRDASLAAAGALAAGTGVLAQAMRGGERHGQLDSLLDAATAAEPDYRLEIAEIDWEIASRKKIRTTAYNGQIPGPLLRLTEGRPVSIEIANRTDHPEIVHWHGQWIPVDVDGSMEEGSPMIPAGGRTRVEFTPRPSGLHWYHTHAMGKRGFSHGLYTGQFGMLMVDPGASPGSYDREQFLALHDWEPYYSASDDGSLMVMYASSSINGRKLGHDEPIQVREGQRVLFHILNASATEVHWLSLPGHRFQVVALDGRPVATQAKVETLRLGPAERVSALVAMDAPGVWVLGEARTSFRNAGMGTVVEYAGRGGKPQAAGQVKMQWEYRAFGDPTPVVRKPDVTLPLVFTSLFRGHGAPDQWMINGKSYPETDAILLKEGLRHRLVFDNRSQDDHPVHLHRHSFELVRIRGGALSGVHKDVVVVEAGTVVEADLLATNPGNTLFHCHQQDHMDAGFMALFRYV